MSEQKKLKVILLRHTLAPEETIALAAKLCYSKSTISDLNDKISQKDQSEFIKKLMDMGHESVLEHVSFTFGVEGVAWRPTSLAPHERLTDLAVVPREKLHTGAAARE